MAHLQQQLSEGRGGEKRRCGFPITAPGSAWFFFRTQVYDLAEVQASFRGRVNMAFHILKSRVMTLVGAGCLIALLGLAQASSANPSARPPVQSEVVHSRLLVYVRELNGETINSQTLVTVTRMANQYWQQMTAQGGQASFDDISPGRYTVQAIAAGWRL